MFRSDLEIEKILEICETCPHKKNAACCNLMNPPCLLKHIVRKGNCPIDKWDEEKLNNLLDNGV